MDLRKIGILLALVAVAIVGCKDKPIGPTDNYGIDGYLTIWVTDTNNNAIVGAEVEHRELGQFIIGVDWTGPFGATHEFHASGDTTTGVEVFTRKAGYVPLVDTFYLSKIQPQLLHVVLPNDTGCLYGRISFIIRDTTGQPISDAELYATWYPGPSWNFTYSIITDSDSLGRIPDECFVVDSTRNAIFAGFSKIGYQTFIDTIAIETSDLKEIYVTLKPE